MMRWIFGPTASSGRWLLAVAATGGLIGYLSLAAADTSSPALNANRRADPAQFQPGTLNADAVRQAEAFGEFPIVWLGQEFEGYPLTNFIHVKRDGQNTVYLIYGDCTPSPDMLEPSCVPPLEVSTKAPGTVPGFDSSVIEPKVAGPLTTVRGVPSRILSGNPFLWTGGVVITVHANTEHQAEALSQLRSANHQASGRNEVKPGESLAPMGQ